MSVSASVRMALSKANKRQISLGELWNTSPQVISNKLRLERWTGEELTQVAAFTGGKLAFVYPDGQQILIDTEAKPKKKKETVKIAKAQPKPEKIKTAGKQKAPKPKTKEQSPKKAETKREKPEIKEEQLSMFFM